MIFEGIGLGLGAAQFGYNIFANERNWRAQQENQRWQREMVAKSWEREDNATQRRVADMEAAGINPLLAAGQPAQSSQAPVKEAPRREMMEYHLADMFYRLGQMKADISRTNAETQRIKVNTQIDKDRLSLDKRRLDQEASHFSRRYELDQRVFNESRRQFNVSERRKVEEFSRRLELDTQQVSSLIALNDARIGLISEQVLTERLRQNGYNIDQIGDIIRYYRESMDALARWKSGETDFVQGAGSVLERSAARIAMTNFFDSIGSSGRTVSEQTVSVFNSLNEILGSYAPSRR